MQPLNVPPRSCGVQPAMTGIVSYLRDHRLQAGDRLPSERDFAEQLRLSRNAVREALSTLTALRVVESRPNSGIYLRELQRDSSFEALVMFSGLGEAPTPAELAETTEVRSHLEVLAARLSCAHRDEADLARLRAVVQQAGQALAGGDNMAPHDTQFHRAVAESTHNSVLVRVLNTFYELTAARRAVWFENQDEGKASADDHQRLLDCIVGRDAAGAEDLVLNHMHRASRHWSRLLDTSSASSEAS